MNPDVLEATERLIPHFLEQLSAWVRLPSVSADGHDPELVRTCAERIRQDLDSIGFEHAQLLEVPNGGHPAVVADHLHAPDAPTLLVYAHYDVQPVGDEALWTSAPFDPQIRDGRLFGRGAVDDKAGLAIQLVGLKSWLDTQGALPVNVKILVEGEEEIGSPNLGYILEEHRERLEADALIITDTANLEAGLPSLTSALRGVTGATIRVRALSGPLHSGMFGGAVPDPVMALAHILTRLTDEQGTVIAPELLENVRSTNGRYQDLPFDEERFREDSGMLPGTAIAGDAGNSVWTKLWALPSITVTAIESQTIAGSSNQVRPQAAARVSLRLVPDMNPKQATDALCAILKRDPPMGCEVEVTPEHAGPWWDGNTTTPAHDAARKALKEGYGVEPVDIGCGGSIPFVETITAALGGIPAILIGLEDPACKAHAENESLLISDFEHGCRAATRFFGYLGAMSPKELRG